MLAPGCYEVYLLLLPLLLLLLQDLLLDSGLLDPAATSFLLVLLGLVQALLGLMLCWSCSLVLCHSCPFWKSPWLDFGGLFSSYHPSMSTGEYSVACPASQEAWRVEAGG